MGVDSAIRSAARHCSGKPDGQGVHPLRVPAGDERRVVQLVCPRQTWKLASDSGLGLTED